MRKANSLMIAAVPKISSKTVCTASPPFFFFGGILRNCTAQQDCWSLRRIPLCGDPLTAKRVSYKGKE